MDAARIACRQAVAGSTSRPNNASRPSPTNWFGWPPASINRLRRRLEEAIDQEYDVERQARLGELGRSAHIDEHADDIAFFTDVDAVPIADKIGVDVGRQHGNNGYIRLRSKLTGQPDGRVGAGANARKHKCFTAGRPRQRAAIANDTHTAG